MGGGGSLVVTGCEVKIVDVKVDDVEVDDVEVDDVEVDDVEVDDVEVDDVEVDDVEVDDVEVDDVEVVGVDVVDVEIVDAKVDVVDVVGVVIFSCDTPSIWVTRDCTWLVGVVVVTTSGSVTGFVVGSSASWVMCASGEQATPGSEQGSATL